MRRAGLCFAASALLSLNALAQVPALRSADPGAIQERQMEEEQRRRDAERQRQKPVTEPLRRDLPEPADKVTKPSAQDTVRFPVREIRFTKSEILTAEELNAVAADYRGRDLSLAELRALAAKINDLYRQKGVVTAKAIVPPQDVSSGVVSIRLIEGRLGKIKLEGNQSTDEGYVVNRVGLAPEELMDLSRLEAALVRFNRTNDAQLRVELAPGERFATTDLRVLVSEPPRHDLRLTADTLGSEATGKERIGLSYTNRSLLGFRDDFSLNTTQAQGQDSRSVNYGFPFNYWGGRVNLGHYVDRTAVKHGALVSLNITGKSVASVLSLRQPVYVTASTQVDIVAGGKWRRNTTWIDRVFLQRTDTSDRNLGAEFSYADDVSSWFVSYVRSLGDSKVADERTGFNIDRGSLRYQRDLGNAFSLRGNLAWQSTGNVLLPSSEQFFIGGEGSVRGYQVGVYGGDTGQTLSLELHHPLFKSGSDGKDFRATGFFFADHGRVKPFRAPNSGLDRYDSLTGVGWGLHAFLGTNAYARLTFGYGLTKVPLVDRSVEINLQVVVSAF